VDKKHINFPKIVRLLSLKVENFENLQKLSKHEQLKTFLELSRNIYPYLVKVFFINLQFNGGTLKSCVKWVQTEITKDVWKVTNYPKAKRNLGTKGRNPSCWRIQQSAILFSLSSQAWWRKKSFQVGGLKVKESFLAFIITLMLVP